MDMLSPTESFTDDAEILEYFSEGQCNALAWEIHKLTGWTLALVSDMPVGSPDYCGHAFVIDSDARAVDIKGRRLLSSLRKDWDFCLHLHRFMSLAEYEREMTLWDNVIHYTKDKKAKLWARHIVDTLAS